jgi:hypothetical protein
MVVAALEPPPLPELCSAPLRELCSAPFRELARLRDPEDPPLPVRRLELDEVLLRDALLREPLLLRDPPLLLRDPPLLLREPLLRDALLRDSLPPFRELLDLEREPLDFARVPLPLLPLPELCDLERVPLDLARVLLPLLPLPELFDLERELLDFARVLLLPLPELLALERVPLDLERVLPAFARDPLEDDFRWVLDGVSADDERSLAWAIRSPLLSIDFPRAVPLVPGKASVKRVCP